MDYNYITWDEYFMAVAQIVKSRSKDPNTKVGACIVRNNRIISTGYNGFPTGCNDDKYPWGKNDSDETKNKYFYVTHAELNAIINAKQSVEDATIYTTLFPCNECTKAIIQSGIKTVIYYSVDLSTQNKIDKNKAIMDMFNDAKVKVYKYMPGNKKIEIEV